jgi:hypothetical protein
MVAFLHPPGDLRPVEIPEEFVRAVAKAFQRSLAAISLKVDLTASFENPFTFDEFLFAVNNGRNSAPGESGMTYRLLQVTPEEIDREIFEHLQEFWTKATTPDQCKRVRIILIQKNAEKPAMTGNFRPIGLLKVLRKVWTKMVTHRILPLMGFHESFSPTNLRFSRAVAPPAS